jgi:hypothetical protein
VEILVEQHLIAEVPVAVQLRVVVLYRPLAMRVTQENLCQAVGALSGGARDNHAAESPTAARDGSHLFRQTVIRRD